MSPNPPNTSAQGGSKKKKNKKKGANKAKAEDADNGAANGPVVEQEDGEDHDATHDEDGEEVDGIQPTDPTTNGSTTKETSQPATIENGDDGAGDAHPQDETPNVDDDIGTITTKSANASLDDERFTALVRDRDSLRAEVTELRKSLEEIQSKHQGDTSLQEQLDEAREGKEHAEAQYRNLLGKVNTIKSQLGERLKSDAEELAQTRSRIEELEDQNGQLQDENQRIASELSEATRQIEENARELSTLRNRSNLSQQNWVKEREELIEQEAYARAEFEEAKQAMHDWEVLAMEERSIREGLSDKVGDLEDQIANLREAYERAISERDTNNLTIEGLQRALQEIQVARKQELREIVENSQTQAEELRNQLRTYEQQASEANAQLDATKKDLERVLPFEHEVKEKNLLIGKLRHEAVILNDHLTKALKFLKKGKPEDNVDRQLVTNHFLHFLELDRSDPKKFQILQLIAALLGWSDEQREQAGLSRPGGGGLKVPKSSFHRTPSTPALGTDLMPESGATSKESLAELWQDFLERKAQAGAKSRTPSMSAGPKSPPAT